MAQTYEEQLEEVQAAISAILTGAQSIQINGRALARANLRELREMEADLRRKIARRSRGPIPVLRAVPK